MHETQFLGLVTIILTTIAIVHLAIKIKNRYFCLVSAFGLLYILGEFIQVFHIGPRWLRWHMSDVGWVSWLTIILVFLNLSPGASVLQRLKNGIRISFLIAVSIEFFQMIPHPSPTGSAPSARGDWVDMTIFIIMFAINMSLVSKIKNEAHSPPQQSK